MTSYFPHACVTEGWVRTYSKFCRSRFLYLWAERKVVGLDWKGKLFWYSKAVSIHFLKSSLPKKSRMTAHLDLGRDWLKEHLATNTLESVGMEQGEKKTKHSASSLKTYDWNLFLICGFSWWLFQTSAFIFLQVISKDNERWVKKIFQALWGKRKYRLFSSLLWSFFPWLSSRLHKLLLRSKHNNFCYHSERVYAWVNVQKFLFIGLFRSIVLRNI